MNEEIFYLAEELNKALKKERAYSFFKVDTSLTEEEKAYKRVEKESLKDLYKTIQSRIL